MIDIDQTICLTPYMDGMHRYELSIPFSQRPGHDLRYALDGSKMKNMGWEPAPVDQRLEEVVNWTLNNERWLTL
jgi:dTDP-glucose 4,6-dehydratase